MSGIVNQDVYAIASALLAHHPEIFLRLKEISAGFHITSARLTATNSSEVDDYKAQAYETIEPLFKNKSELQKTLLTAVAGGASVDELLAEKARLQTAMLELSLS